MKKLTKVVALVCGLALAALAHAQAWPTKPVRIIIPFPPGGATDIIGRLIAQKLQDSLGQTMVIENRGGAGGNVGAIEAAKAAPDGYTLFFTSGSVITANEHIYRNMGFNPAQDFVAITNCVTGPQVVVVSANSPYKTLKELIAAAKAKPGMTFGHAGIGSQVHLAGENFVYSAGFEARHIPYKGENPAITDLVAGQLDFAVPNLAAAIGFITSGKLRALGVTSPKRMPQVPDVPTVAETVPGFENAGWFGFVAPRGTPREVIDRMHKDTVMALQSTELKARLYAQAMTPVGDTPEHFEKYIKEERARWAKIVAIRKISVQ